MCEYKNCNVYKINKKCNEECPDFKSEDCEHIILKKCYNCNGTGIDKIPMDLSGEDYCIFCDGNGYIKILPSE